MEVGSRFRRWWRWCDAGLKSDIQYIRRKWKKAVKEWTTSIGVKASRSDRRWGTGYWYCWCMVNQKGKKKKRHHAYVSMPRVWLCEVLRSESGEILIRHDGNKKCNVQKKDNWKIKAWPAPACDVVSDRGRGPKEIMECCEKQQIYSSYSYSPLRGRWISESNASSSAQFVEFAANRRCFRVRVC